MKPDPVVGNINNPYQQGSRECMHQLDHLYTLCILPGIKWRISDQDTVFDQDPVQVKLVM